MLSWLRDGAFLQDRPRVVANLYDTVHCPVLVGSAGDGLVEGDWFDDAISETACRRWYI